MEAVFVFILIPISFNRTKGVGHSTECRLHRTAKHKQTISIADRDQSQLSVVIL